MVLIIIAIVYFNRKSLVDILERVSGLKMMGVEVQLNAKEQLSKAVGLETRIKTTVSGDKKKIKITEDDERRAIKRAAHMIDVLKGRTVLWVDDLPDNNLHEVQTLKELGLQVVQLVTNQAATDRLRSGDLRAHVVISDISRPDGQPNGLALLDEFADHDIDIPIIYYITRIDEGEPLPAANDGTTAFGLTNRPDELVHLVLDVLERRWPLS